jgi:hypothetical protein
MEQVTCIGGVFCKLLDVLIRFKYCIVTIRKRHLSPDFGVGQKIQILEISTICPRFNFAARLELGQDAPFLDGHYIGFDDQRLMIYYVC